MYERIQEIRKKNPNDLTLEEVRALTDEFHDYGCEKRKGQIARNVEKHDRPRATSDDVPEGLRTLMDGSNYLQYSRSGLYIYYSKETIKAAVDNRLTAHGMHKLPPEELGENGQLYTIHGICNADIDVPIFHILTRKKNEACMRRHESAEIVDDNRGLNVPFTSSTWEGTSVPSSKCAEELPLVVEMREVPCIPT
ncbi:hypothetical protein Aduo_001057 [Ancylostoma duodenale]